VLLDVAAAIRFLGVVAAALAPEPGTVNAVGTLIAEGPRRVPAVNVDDRRRAEFTEAEIDEILRQAGFRSLPAAAAREAPG
jgi:alkylhydroperoxidase family enzyme